MIDRANYALGNVVPHDQTSFTEPSHYMAFTAIPYHYDTVHLVTRFPKRQGFGGYLSPLSMTCWMLVVLCSILVAFLVYFSPITKVDMADTILMTFLYMVTGATNKNLDIYANSTLKGGKTVF